MKIFEGRHDDEMAARLIGFVRDWATMLTNEFVRLRAGGVILDRRAVLLPSVPQPHLPALVGLLVRSGAAFLGDEMVNLDPIRHRIHGLSLPLRVDADDLMLFPELRREPSSAPRWKLDPGPGLEGITTRRTVAVQELGGMQGGPANVGWIVFPQFEPGSETRLEPFGGAPALFAFTQAVMNLHVWEERALTLMRDVLEKVAVSRLVIGSLPEAADLIRRTAPGLLKGVTA